MTDSRCILCDSSTCVDTPWGGYLFEGKKYSIVKCSGCGFMFLNPLPSQETLNKIYKKDAYFDNYFATPTGIKGYLENMFDGDSCDDSIISLIKKYKKSGRLLDIGCAGGRFLVNARNAGYEGFGIEPNSKMAEHAKSLGLNVTCCILEEAPFGQERFDIIYAGDTLEHILEIKKGMKIIRELLAGDGILVIKQPLMYNNSPFNLFLRLHMLFKENKHTDYPPAHLWEFNAVTFREFLGKMGFAVAYYKVLEGKAKPLAVYKAPTIKNRIGFCIKNFSSFISNHVFNKFDLGDRVIVVCRKAGTAQ